MPRPNRCVPPATCVVLLSIVCQAAGADVVIQTQRIRAAIGQDGVWRSLVDKRTGKDWCYTDRSVRLADAHINDKPTAVTSIEQTGRQLRLTFGRTGYRPDVPPHIWQREFQHRFGKAAGPVEAAYRSASQVLPLLTAARLHSASEWRTWPRSWGRPWSRGRPGGRAPTTLRRCMIGRRRTSARRLRFLRPGG